MPPLVPAKYERHCSRSQDASRLASQLYKSVTIGWIREPTLVNNSKSKKECERSITKKWYGITSITAIEIEIRRHRVKTRCQLASTIAG
ncbi:hypothetical protein CR513_26496, partial [Mucuna pruriens]